MNYTKPINIAFFGTDTYSVAFLNHLILHSNITVKYVVTKQDRKIGRGHILTPNPVFKVANKNKITTFKITSLLKNPTQLSKIEWESLDFAVVVSFGYILPNVILRQLPNRFINVHPSLLPKYRGPWPIGGSIINAETITGNTIMVLNEGMDEGPILAQEKCKISSNDTIISLSKKLIEKGKPLLIHTLYNYKKGTIKLINQENSKATYTKMLENEDGLVTLKENPAKLYNMYRAYLAWPGLKTPLGNLENFLNIHTKLKNKKIFVKLTDIVLTKDGCIQINKIQLSNKAEIKLQDFINGYRLK